MRTNLRRRLAALLGIATIAGSLLATVAAPGVALGADAGCTALGGTEAAGTCTVDGTVAVSGTINVNLNLVLQDDAHLDASKSGVTLNVSGDMVMEAGSIFEADDDNVPTPNTGARNITLNVDGDFSMLAGSRLTADNNVQGGEGGDITITVSGDMLMGGTDGDDHCRTASAPGGLGFYVYDTFKYPNVYVDPDLGARISAHRFGASSAAAGGNIVITVGNYDVPPTGTLTMERCSLIDVSSRGSAGEINLTAGHTANLDGLVLSESGLPGTGAVQPRGGGPINVRAGCNLTVSDTGVISSKGQDPGADLVHLKGCNVLIQGVVQSTTTGGHALPTNPPNLCNNDPVAHPAGDAKGFTACVRILGETITIDAQNGNGNVNTDGVRAPMRSWIDIFSTLDTTILADPVGAGVKWAVSAQACATGPCSNSFGGVITIKAIGGKVVTDGQAAVKANATAIGSDGGVITIHAAGDGVGTPATPNATSNVDLDGSFIEANGPTSSNTNGGNIEVKSFNGSITGTAASHIEAKGGPAPGTGSIALLQCSNTDQYQGTLTAAVVVEIDFLCGGAITVPADAQALFDANAAIWDACDTQEAGSKSGFKFDDKNNSGSYDAGDEALADWPINLLNAADNSLVIPTTTDDLGTYEFAGLAPGTYRVCEGAGPAGYVQTFPNAGTADPPGEAITDQCPAPNVWGYEFTITGSENLRGNDFGNFNEPDQFCVKQPVRDALNPDTGHWPGNDGPDVVVRVDLGESVQDAVDNEGDSNNDGYIIIAVSAHADGSLGGSANQKVVIDDDYTENLPFALIGCSVTLTGGGSDPSIWVKSTANAKDITVNGRTTDIFVMDLHGANSTAAGVQTNDSNTYFRNVYGTDSAVGVKLLGNNNTFHNGKAEDNTGDGMQVVGNGNDIEDTDAFDNGGDGFDVAGNNNHLEGLDAGDGGKGNDGDGVHVVGDGNTLEEVDAFANGGDGIEVIGDSNTLDGCHAGDKNKGNVGHGIVVDGDNNNLIENEASANGGDGFRISGTNNELEDNESNAGGDEENAGFEYNFANAIIDGGGNQKDDAAFNQSAAGTYE